MNTPDWIKIVAASKDELAAEALKLIDELGGPEAAEEALSSLQGMGLSKQTNWVLDDVYVESEISDSDKKFFSEGEEALGEVPPAEKKEEQAPPKPKKKRTKKPRVVEPEIVEPSGGPLVERPSYTPLAPEVKEQKAKYLSTVLMALLGLGSLYGLEQWLKQNDLASVKHVIEQTQGVKGTPADVSKKEDAPKVQAPHSHESSKIKAIRDKLYDNEQKQLALTRDVQKEKRKGTEGTPGSSYEKYYEGKAGKELKEVEKELAALRQEHLNLVDQLNKQFAAEREEALKKIPPQKSYEKGD